MKKYREQELGDRVQHGVPLSLGYCSIKGTNFSFKVYIGISNSVLELQCSYVI